MAKMSALQEEAQGTMEKDILFQHPCSISKASSVELSCANKRMKSEDTVEDDYDYDDIVELYTSLDDNGILEPGGGLGQGRPVADDPDLRPSTPLSATFRLSFQDPEDVSPRPYEDEGDPSLEEVVKGLRDSSEDGEGSDRAETEDGRAVAETPSSVADKGTTTSSPWTGDDTDPDFISGPDCDDEPRMFTPASTRASTVDDVPDVANGTPRDRTDSVDTVSSLIPDAIDYELPWIRDRNYPEVIVENIEPDSVQPNHNDSWDIVRSTEVEDGHSIEFPSEPDLISAGNLSRNSTGSSPVQPTVANNPKFTKQIVSEPEEYIDDPVNTPRSTRPEVPGHSSPVRPAVEEYRNLIKDRDFNPSLELPKEHRNQIGYCEPSVEKPETIDTIGIGQDAKGLNQRHKQHPARWLDTGNSSSVNKRSHASERCVPPRQQDTHASKQLPSRPKHAVPNKHKKSHGENPKTPSQVTALSRTESVTKALPPLGSIIKFDHVSLAAELAQKPSRPSDPKQPRIDLSDHRKLDPKPIQDLQLRSKSRAESKPLSSAKKKRSEEAEATKSSEKDTRSKVPKSTKEPKVSKSDAIRSCPHDCKDRVSHTFLMEPQRFNPYTEPWLTVNENYRDESYARNVIMHVQQPEIIRYKLFNERDPRVELNTACVELHRMVTRYLEAVAPGNIWSREDLMKSAFEAGLWFGAFSLKKGVVDSLFDIGRVTVEDFNVLLRCRREDEQLDLKVEGDDPAGNTYEWAASITLCPSGWILKDHMDTEAGVCPDELRDSAFAPQWRDGVGQFLSCPEASNNFEYAMRCSTFFVQIRRPQSATDHHLAAHLWAPCQLYFNFKGCELTDLEPEDVYIRLEEHTFRKIQKTQAIVCAVRTTLIPLREMHRDEVSKILQIVGTWPKTMAEKFGRDIWQHLLVRYLEEMRAYTEEHGDYPFCKQAAGRARPANDPKDRSTGLPQYDKIPKDEGIDIRHPDQWRATRLGAAPSLAASIPLGEVTLGEMVAPLDDFS